MSDELTEKLPGTTAPLTDSLKIDVIIERLDVMQKSADAFRVDLRKLGHMIEQLGLTLLGIQADMRDFAERIVTLEQKAS